ncbi:pseudouridine-5'-phosphatase isoform X2 [Leptinotarsa decemlineata]|uniref:pseudouridine-5'-phosphatase isoform X2 n=1 Tax=Leptinotarsa decemlineata TaxID=7539 RepID=UPI000C253C50|nr:pseudouridine-5'-phosphatase-like isoform X2 [Leptinotarsa decemlineata]
MSALKQIKKVSHVIFDMDGVLLDTEIIYKKAIQSIAGRFGKMYTPQIQGKVIGTVERESSRIAVEMMKLPISVDKFQIEFRTTAHQQMHNVAMMPGAEQLVKHLYEHKIPIAVATSSSLASFELKTAKHKAFFALFNHIVCGGSDPEVRKGKPCPDIFLVCAERFKDKPLAEKCLVFEDAPNGVAAALKAGMQVVMIPDENVPAEMLIEAPIKINRLEEAPLELFGLPPLKS